MKVWLSGDKKSNSGYPAHPLSERNGVRRTNSVNNVFRSGLGDVAFVELTVASNVARTKGLAGWV